MKDKYLISKHLNTSYTDVGNITPREREMLIEFILEDLERQKKAIDEAKGEQALE